MRSRAGPAQGAMTEANALNVKTLARVSGCLLTLALLSACATAPTITSQNESSQYRSRAARNSRNYTPPGPASDPWGPYITEAAGKYDVPERWIREVMRQESGGRLYGRGGDLVTSGAGAMGLMQVMPGTYDELRARYSELGDDPYDPRNNILAGTAYVREMYDIYGSPGFLAAYNAGPGRLDDYLTRNRTLPEETRRYVANIGPRITGAEPQRGSPGAQFAMNNLGSSTLGAGPRYAASSRYSAPPASPVSTPVSSPIVLAAAPIIKLNPVQPAPIQLASSMQMAQPSQPSAPAAPGPYIVLAPQPPEPEAPAAPAPQQFAQLPEPSRAPYDTFRPSTPMPAPLPASASRQFAQIPEPPPFQPRPQSQPNIAVPVVAYLQPVPPASRSQAQMASAALVPASPRGSAFAFVSPASAEPIGIRHAGAVTGGWGVQVGAFANEGLAASANVAARDHVRDLLGASRTSITPVRQPGGTLYRARLIGLSRDAAAQACERLARTRTTCMMVSPDAQS